jgi:hypothetical protein
MDVTVLSRKDLSDDAGFPNQWWNVVLLQQRQVSNRKLPSATWSTAEADAGIL